MSAATDRPVELSSERPVALTAMVSSVDAPQLAISMTGKLSLNGQILQLDDLKGAVDQDPFGGSAAIDLSRSRPHARAEVNFTRVRVSHAPPAAVVDGDHRAVVSQTRADKPWSDAPIDLLPLNLFDADVKLSAGELLLGKARLAPAAVDIKLVSGVAVIALSRTQLYGGEARGTLVFDASGQHPRCISQITLSGVSALALFEDATDFDRLDGHIDAKLDLSASGESVHALLSTLGGTADIEFADATVRGVNLPRMVQLLTKKSLQGWHDDGSTRLESLGATFRVKDGVATTDDLRAIGPLVSVTGRGSVDLVGRSLEFVTDPKLVLALKGEGRAADPVGLGVPVIVRGPWSSPQIYPDVANVLENPDNAYAKLADLGAGLFGLAKKRPGFSLESIVDEVASIVADPERQPSAPKRQELLGQDPAKPAAVEPPSPEIAGHLQIAEAKANVRVALVIGNASYPDNGEPLAEPIKDARAMAEALRKSGFEVIVGENLAKQATRAAIANFKAKVKPGSAALIFFSGFGIQSQRQSYVIPVDAQIWTEADVSRDGVSLEQVLTDLDSLGASIKIAIIDASRKNPFERRFRRYSAGLASIDAPTGTLVLSAAAPGRVGIEDRTGGSVFITQLLKEMRSPGVPAEEVFNRTRVGVSRASNSAQVPWMSSSLSEVFYFDATTSIPASSVIVEPAHPAASATKAERPKAENSPVEPPKLESAKAETAPPSKPQASPSTTTGRLPNGANQTLKTLGDAIRLHPGDANAFYRRGLVYAENADYEHAAADFSEAIRLNPSDAEALNNRCWTRAILGQLQTALDDCNEA
ncbi:MAG TPA: caspase family protein, partial [Xanthobacteraceae bacterium]|nr:caspase family protein [Xanthobacteraceae bacterium]